MPEWLRHLVIAASLGLVVGVVATAATSWWALSNVEGGVAPVAGQLHVRQGQAFVAAHDHAFGVRFANLERLLKPLVNEPIDVIAVPSWAEPIEPRRDAGHWQIGTLAIGWPWPGIARQWSESDPGLGFLPPVELDDDGSTIRRAAERFFRPAPSMHLGVLGRGLLGNVLVFALPATALVFLALVRRAKRVPTSGATRRG